MRQDYYGTKRVTAWRSDWPEKDTGEIPSGEGYKVKYQDGYTSWSPRAAFEAAYQPIDAMSFGHAVEALKAGNRVCRSGWNGKGMFLFHVGGGSMSHPQLDQDEEALPYIAMKTVQGAVVPWLASQTDILADDWQIVEAAA